MKKFSQIFFGFSILCLVSVMLQSSGYVNAAYDGSGTFLRVTDFTADRDAGPPNNVLSADKFDDELDGMAVGLSTAITKDNQTTTTAKIDFNTLGIATDLISESTAATGVTIDSVLLKDNIVTATTGTFTNIGGTLTTAAQANVTSLGTLTSATISGNLTVDTTTLFVDASANEVGVGTILPIVDFHVNPSNVSEVWSPAAGTVAVFETASGAGSGVTILGLDSQLNFADAASETVGQIAYDHSADAMTFTAGGSARAVLDAGLVIGSPTGGDKGSGTINATGLFVDGVDVGAGSLLIVNDLSDVASASTSRTNLGVAIGSDVQAFDATLTSIAALGTAADKLAFTTGVDTWAESALTTAGRALIDDASASAQRTTLGLGTLAVQNTVGTSDYDANSVDLAAMEHGTSGDILIYGASGVPSRLAKGTDDQILTLASGLPSWADNAGGGGGATQVLQVQDQKTTGTAGGSSSVGDQTRTLNTVVTNTISGASLSSDQITLPAGTYDVHALSASYRNDQNRNYLYNITDAAVIAETLGVGNFNRVVSSAFGDIAITQGRFTLAATKVIELRHYFTSSQTTNGLGIAVSDGRTEVFSNVFIEKVGSGSGPDPLGWTKHPTVHTSVSSGTTLDWTAIPSTATTIRIIYSDVSFNNAAELALLMGDAGGFETSGYVGNVNNSGGNSPWSSEALINRASAAADVINGEINLTNITGNSWGISGQATEDTSGYFLSNGRKATSATLTQIRVQSDDLTGAFDGGNLALYYQWRTNIPMTLH